MILLLIALQLADRGADSAAFVSYRRCAVDALSRRSKAKLTAEQVARIIQPQCVAENAIAMMHMAANSLDRELAGHHDVHEAGSDRFLTMEANLFSELAIASNSEKSNAQD